MAVLDLLVVSMQVNIFCGIDKEEQYNHRVYVMLLRRESSVARLRHVEKSCVDYFDRCYVMTIIFILSRY